MLWIFSGDGGTCTNDLWKFSTTTGNWTWMKGESSGSPASVYGTIGSPDPANTPGRRRSGASWFDGEGNLWLLGGESQTGTGGDFNDLWKYTIATGNWTWMKGSKTRDPLGVYGSRGVANASNTPGGRRLAATWTRGDGKLYLFGGGGFAASGAFGHLNDLWQDDLVSGNWTWIKGSSGRDAPANYGVQGEPDSTNTPGGRYGAVTWTDDRENFWLFGGLGFDSENNLSWLSDLWLFDPITANWTWMKGPSTGFQYGVYGVRGVADASNLPGAHVYSCSWTTTGGELWLFGGSGYGESAPLGNLNDLWKLINIHPTQAQYYNWTQYQ